MRLTRDEIILITGILIALVTGAVVKHYRSQRRVEAAAIASPATAIKADSKR